MAHLGRWDRDSHPPESQPRCQAAGRSLQAAWFSARQVAPHSCPPNCLAGAVVMAEGLLPGATRGILAAVDVARPVIRVW
jgi:hypothetical protein